MDYQTLEQFREAYAKKVKHGWMVSLMAALGLSMFYLTFLFATNGGRVTGAEIFSALMPGMVAFVFAVVVMMLRSRKEARDYQRAYKAYFVERNLRKFFTNIYYNHAQGLAPSEISATGMMRTGDLFGSNDLTYGTYKDVKFAQADVHMQEAHTDSDGDTYYVTIFKGRWMIFEFPKQFNFRLLVTTHKIQGALIPKDIKKGKKFQKIKVESSDFNKKFDVYGEDGFETFYLLDPAMIDKIEKLSETYGKPFVLCFHNNRLHVGLNDGKDAFEPPNALKPINEQEEDEKIARDIRVVTDLVEGLSLERRLFSRT